MLKSFNQLLFLNVYLDAVCMRMVIHQIDQERLAWSHWQWHFEINVDCMLSRINNCFNHLIQIFAFIRFLIWWYFKNHMQCYSEVFILAALKNVLFMAMFVLEITLLSSIILLILLLVMYHKVDKAEGKNEKKI